MTEDSHLIAEWNDRLAGPVTATLIRSGGPGDGPFLEFCEKFRRCAPRVVFLQLTSPEAGPAIEVRPGLRYRAIPEGPELGPFLEALAGDKTAEALPLAASGQAEYLPVSLRLYIADRCPFCPAAVRSLLPFTGEGGEVAVTIVDAVRFPDDAAADGIRSVPALIFRDPAGGDRFCWSGALNLPEILSVLATRDPAGLGAESMVGMIEAGDAAGLAALMLKREAIFPAFLDLLTHEKWPTRLGAMVVAETLAEERPELGASLVEPLWRVFPDADETIQGDILYLIGLVGDPGSLGRLVSVAEGSFPARVKEAAREAAAEIQSGHGMPRAGEGALQPTQRRNA